MLCRGGFDIYHLSFCLCRSAIAVEYIYISESDSWHHVWRVSKKIMRFECPHPEQCSQGWPGQVIMRLFFGFPQNFSCLSLCMFSTEKNTSWPLVSTKGASLWKSGSCDLQGLSLCFQYRTMQRAETLPFSKGISVLFQCRMVVTSLIFCSAVDRTWLI